VRLGFWQLDRLEERRALNAEIGAGLEVGPAPLDDVLAGDAPAYRRVTASGTWAPGDEVILYGRSLDGRPGNHVLTPLTLDDGRAILVDRGWVPTTVSSPPVTGAEAPAAGSVSVEGILLPGDDQGSSDGSDGSTFDARPDQVRSVDVGALDATIDADLVDGVYLLLARQTPPQERPIPAPLPELDEGPHLSYAIQWFSFAAIALIGYGVLARRRGRTSVAAHGSTHGGGS
jgi:surfeit locus 1 family protein